MQTLSFAGNSRAHHKIQRLLIVSLLLFVTACGTLPKDATREPSYALVPGEKSTLATNLAPLLAQHEGKSGFRPIAQGEMAFTARAQLAMAAQESIDIQYYIWHLDLTGRVIYESLLLAADRGVRVRLLLDDMDTAGKDDFLRNIDHHPNIEIRLFNPFANRNLRAGDFLLDTWRVNRRMHNKTFTADNSATIFGGRNIGDEYFDATEAVSFGDMDALGVGPVARDVSNQFDLYWNSKYVYPLASFKWKAPVSDDDYRAFRKSSADYLEQARKTRYARILRDVELAKVERISEVDYVWSDWVLGFDDPSAIEMNEMTLDTHLALKLLKAMEQTKEDLLIVSPYFVPGEKFTQFLNELEAKGVRVRILTNSLQANDVSMVHAGYMRYREDLVRGGVELYEYRATSNKARRKLKRERIDVEKTSLHAKFFTVDETFLFVGSFNLDGRSAKLNTELGAYFAAPVQAATLSDNFDQLMREVAYRVVINDDGDLEWVGENDGQEIRLDREPDTSWWKRFSTQVLSVFVPESQL